MKKGLVFLLMIYMISTQSKVFAADWVRVGTSECYIDSETVVKKEDLLWFWELSELSVSAKTQEKRLIQYAICLSDPYRVSSYWGCSYNSKNQPQDGILHTHSLQGPLEELMEREITFALGFAKDGEHSEVMPALLDVK